MREKRTIKRQGFTLVELLIVIVVIGILSAMMMLSSTEATTSARASNIVTNLRNLKTAALAYYTDNLDTYNSSLELSSDVDIKVLVKYLKAGGNVSTSGVDSEFNGYVFKNDTGNKAWFVGYESATDKRIQEKLKGRAASVQLLGSNTIPTSSSSQQYSSGQNVYMIVLGGSEATTNP